MGKRTFLIIAALASSAAMSARAEGVSETTLMTGAGASSLALLLQCVPYARTVSGIQIYGDAWTWWGQADGKYARGYRPKVGAVMAFKPYGKMELGHVAAVSKIVNSRTVLLRHANWSLINGTRGQIEDDVQATDVSPNNDWSEVRVWFAPLQGLGGTAWPVQGFIYNEKPKRKDMLVRERADRREVNTISSVKVADPFANDPIGAIIAAYRR